MDISFVYFGQQSFVSMSFANVFSQYTLLFQLTVFITKQMFLILMKSFLFNYFFSVASKKPSLSPRTIRFSPVLPFRNFIVIYFHALKGRVTEPERETFYLLVYSPSGCNSPGLARPKPGTPSCVAGAQVLLTILRCFARCISRARDQKWRSQDPNRRSYGALASRAVAPPTAPQCLPHLLEPCGAESSRLLQTLCPSPSRRFLSVTPGAQHRAPHSSRESLGQMDA